MGQITIDTLALLARYDIVICPIVFTQGLPANVIPTKEGIYSSNNKGLPTNVIPTKEGIYSLASLCIANFLTMKKK